MIQLERETTAHETVRVKLGALHVNAYRGGTYDIYGAGWTAFVYHPDGGSILAKATADTEHEAIAKALRTAEALAETIRAAVAAARSEVP
jgi:hypothetical protein